jgi:hypothetical protein
MGMITLTVGTINGVAPEKSLHVIDSECIEDMTGDGNVASGAATLNVKRYDSRASGSVTMLETWVVTETVAAVKAAAIASEQASATGAKIPSGALVAGVRTISDANVTTSSIAVVQKISLGGTVAVGLYKVACTAGTVTITALQVDGTTTQSASTDSVMGYIVY